MTDKAVTDKGQLPVYKIIVAGDGSVGKTSLIRRYCEGMFDASRVMTIGVDFQTKVMTVGQKTIKLSIWDIAGQERFGAFRESFYRGARAVALVFDTTEPASFENIARWRDEIINIVPDVPMVLIANKIDLELAVSLEQARSWSQEFNMPFLETSAATGKNVGEFFKGLAYLALHGVPGK